MFPTSNYMNGSFFNDSIYTTTTTTPHFSKQQQEDPAAPFCFFHMPSPYNIPYHDQELELQDPDDLLLFQQDHYHHHQQQQQQPIVLKNINEQENNVQQQHQDQEPNSQSKISVRPPKRSFCKRDRHSKINTAQGPRDRRVRLSLKVARDFFDLQDQLGFDKASKTVEWLLLQAKPEVKKIFCNNNGIDSSNSTRTGGAAAASSASDCEAAAVSAVSVPIQQYSCPKDKQKRTRMPRKKTVCFDPVAREESREKARARARERTREKIKSRIMVEVDANHEHVTMTSTTSTSSPSCETGTAGSTDWPEESAGRTHHSNMILQQLLEQESGASEELNIDADESLMMILTNNHLYNLIHQDQHQFSS